LLKFHQNLAIVNSCFPPFVPIAYKTLSIIPKLYVNLPISLFYINIARITIFFSGPALGNARV